MLSGSPDSEAARRHAEELLDDARRRAHGSGPAMTLVAGAVLGGAAALVIWVGMRSVFERPVFARQNYRGVTLPTGVGIIVPLAVRRRDGGADAC